MNKHQIKSVSQILIISVFVIITIIGGIMASLSILEDETVNAKVQVAKLQAENFSQSLTQTMTNVELVFDNLNSLIAIKDTDLNKVFTTLLENNPQIRSINYLDNNNKVKYSSNPLNINTSLSINEFYPKPFFNHSILRVGNTHKGRDIYEGVESSSTQTDNKKSSTFIPISQKYTNYSLVLALNPEYFINQFSSKLQSYAYVDILRFDNKQLVSSDSRLQMGKKAKENPILLKAKETSFASGITTIENSTYIIAYQLTPQYPFVVGVRIAYDKSLQGWQDKRYSFFTLTTTIVVICVVLVLVLIFLYSNKHQEELKRHKQQIKNQKKFKILFENTHFLSSIVSKEGSIKDMNHHALDFFNHANNKVFNTPFWKLDCFNQEERQWLKSAILNFNPNKQYYKELHVINDKGTLSVLDFMIFQIDLGHTYELFLISSDITQRKKYEYKLREALTVFENTQDGIVITNKESYILNVNPAFEFISGYKKHEVINKKTNILKSEIHDDRFYKEFWEDLIANGSWQGEFINKKKNGELWSEWLVINEVKNKEGEVTHYIGIFHDTTKQKTQEKELKKQEEILYHQSKMAAMGEMIENIAHQWRQPLSVISSISTGMQLRMEIGEVSKEEYKKDMQSINKTAQYLSKTIDDFRNFLRNDKSKCAFQIDAAIEKALDIVQSKLRNRHIEVIQKIDPITYTGFENELIQVFINLLNNARDALEVQETEEKYIFIEAHERENVINIEIKDNAGGVSKDIINRIFEPYFTTKHQSTGTGIGLYMSEQIVCNHMEGNLTVVNETYEFENKTYKGACFKIVFYK